MKIDVRNDGAKVGLSLAGRFDFHAHREFRNAYEGALTGNSGKEIEIDMGNVEYMDSSALGMLLLLRERAQNAQKSVTLANCKGAVKQVLEIANFQKLFPMR